jgi:hypothetical protein
MEALTEAETEELLDESLRYTALNALRFVGKDADKEYPDDPTNWRPPKGPTGGGAEDDFFPAGW